MNAVSVTTRPTTPEIPGTSIPPTDPKLTQPVLYRTTIRTFVHPELQEQSMAEATLEAIRKELPKCRRNIGYILDVIEANSIMPVRLDHTSGYYMIDVDVVLQTLLPRIGDHYRCVVTLTYAEGMFVQFDQLRIIVPRTSSSRLFKVGEWVVVRITNVRFYKHEYQCVGCIV